MCMYLHKIGLLCTYAGFIYHYIPMTHGLHYQSMCMLEIALMQMYVTTGHSLLLT